MSKPMLNKIIIQYFLTSIPIATSLAWNGVITSLLENTLPFKQNDSLITKLVYALIYTFLVISLYYFLIPMFPFMTDTTKKSCRKAMKNGISIDIDDDDN